MQITIIGSGNIAHHLGKAFYGAGHRIAQVYSRNRENAEILAKDVESERIDDLSALKTDADLYVLAVSDQAISAVVEALPKSLSGIVVHTSGATSVALLDRFAHYGVIYPPQSLSKHVEADLSEIPFAIEANQEANYQKLLALMQPLAPKSFQANSEQRLALHLSAVFANNFSNAMYRIAFELLAKQNLPVNLIRPIIAETAKKVQQHDPKSVQTGPAKRNDSETMEKHLNYLKQLPDWQSIYQIISDFIIKSEI
ncbi:Rossmann-like and DUF2520 domain-containing protein [Sphingobacterium corticis]|uniref:Rossmann-like and DUF2520 domain-containing protein n=1 Tax=Sphingobacterium corticis TaxID=1812823 RepID=A0ABW5NFT8_9SPHI